MSNRTTFCAMAALALLLAAATSQARWMNPSTGRFQTMDTEEGGAEDASGLHKYLYCGANPANHNDPSGHDFGLISLSIASTIGIALDSQYNSVISVIGNSTMNTIIGVQSGYSIGQIVALNIVENAGAVIAGKLIGQATKLRNLPGIVRGLGRLIQGGRWLRGSQGNAGYIPEQIAVKLAGQKFPNFDEFRAAFWRLVGEDAELSKGFSVQNVARMKNGKAPYAVTSQQVGGRVTYELHHITPIQHEGQVYNVDNLIVCTPRYHQEVLDPSYHY